MKRGSGIKDRDDKSSGIEILKADAFVKINPTAPLILAKQAARRNEIDQFRMLRSEHPKIVND